MKGAIFHFGNRFLEDFYQCSWVEFCLLSPTATEVKCSSAISQVFTDKNTMNSSPLKNFTHNKLLSMTQELWKQKNFRGMLLNGLL